MLNSVKHIIELWLNYCLLVFYQRNQRMIFYILLEEYWWGGVQLIDRSPCVIFSLCQRHCKGSVWWNSREKVPSPHQTWHMATLFAWGLEENSSSGASIESSLLGEEGEILKDTFPPSDPVQYPVLLHS